MLSYLLWEKHGYGGQPVEIEIEGSMFRVTNGWWNLEDTPAAWVELPEGAADAIEAAFENSDYWNWLSSYHDSDITDGTTWSIKVRAGRTGNRRKNCSGVND